MAQDILAILEGPVRILVGNPVTSGAPDTFPADNVPYLGNWGGNWRELGFTTEDGVTFSFDADWTDVMTAQSRSPVKYLRGTSNERVSCSLLELTLENMMAVMGRGAITTSPAPPGGYGHKDFTLSEATTVRPVAIGVEGIAPPDDLGVPRRILFPYGLAVSSGDVQMRIGQPSALPTEFRRIGGTNGIVIIRDVLKG